MQLVEKNTPEHKNLCNLYNVLWPAKEGEERASLKDLKVHTFFRFNEKGDESWVRFYREDNQFTFWMDAFLTELIFSGEEIVGDLEPSVMSNMLKADYELPESWLEVKESHPEDTVTQAEYRALEGLTTSLRNKMQSSLKEITVKADRFVAASRKRDHDLYMTFNIVGEDKLQFALRFDKVYPKLPPEGVQLGTAKEMVIDIHEKDQITLGVFNRLKSLENKINRDIKRNREAGKFGEAATKLYDKAARTLLFAATHFTKRLYQFDGDHGKAEMVNVTNSILALLAEAQESVQTEYPNSTVGLDVNSWVMWIYTDKPEPPVRSADPKFDFKEIILEGYTESFTNALMGHLMGVGSPLIKPYKYLMKADATDGHEVGSIRKA